MKKTYLFLMMLIVTFISAQSISASKLLHYSNSQNISTISKDLKQLGFQTRTDNSEGYLIYQFVKKKSRGIEKVEMGKNSELFMFTYKTDRSIYEILKNKLLSTDYQYAYGYKNVKYYENGKLRIGADDVNGIISIFKPLK